MGAQKDAYELLAPPGSFLHIDDFPGGPAHLAKHLLALDADDSAYADFFGHVGAGEFAGAPVSALCRLCDVVNFLSDASSSSSSAFDHSAHDLAEYWTPDDCNTNSLYGDGEEDEDSYHFYASSANEL